MLYNRYMYDSLEEHFSALKRILRYIQGTLHLGLQLYFYVVDKLVSYTDADCLVALILFDLPLNTEFSLVINRSLGLLKDNLLYLDPVPKLSIEGLPMLLLNPIRFVIFFSSFNAQYTKSF